MTTKQKKGSAIDDLIAASVIETEAIDLGDGRTVIVRELNGRERFEAAALETSNRWDAMLWLCDKGMHDPVSPGTEKLEQLKPEWVVKIAKGVMGLSGMSEDSIEEVENESANVSDGGTS